MCITTTQIITTDVSRLQSNQTFISTQTLAFQIQYKYNNQRTILM